ncbi:sulfatase [Tautonia sociabilis]|uniref:Sulfatase N-terminal domain-containing protein n=1 Tax=Tautonia sociabilis TaxID=2080755 RepID=A0A432MKQ3_9BACT|nr:sulfatase [Tautonia sociabilis]RUL87839.1 hypothetical protein TsocGM_09895 [Tautonia sociabilis]
MPGTEPTRRPPPILRVRAASKRLLRHGRHARVVSARLARALPPAPSVSAPAIWALCGWIGLACGLLEAVLLLSWREVFEPLLGSPDLWRNWHSPWMAPLANASLFALAGGALGLLRRLLPRAVAVALPILLVFVGVRAALGTIPGLHPAAVFLLALGTAVRLGPRARLDSPRFRSFARRSLPYLAGGWLALLLTCGVVPASREPLGLRLGPEPSRGAPNVLLVVLDTVRADHLSLHGYERPTSPRLEALSRRGVRFDEARATAPFTLGTHASLFTGLPMSQTSAGVNSPLDGSRRTLAEHLRNRGYATGGFVGNIFYGSAHYGLDRGFLHYHDVPGNITRRITPREFLRSCRLGADLITRFEREWGLFSPMQRRRLDASELNQALFSWVDRTRRFGRPYFVFVNYFDAHSPYSLPPQAPRPYSRVSDARLEAELDRLSALEAERDADPSGPEPKALTAARAEVAALIRDAYDDGICWADRQLGALLDGLDARGLLDNTLVIVTSDHGEMLGEHGLIGHGMSLHRPLVHVPLVVAGARGMSVPQGRSVPSAVSVRDVPATVLRLLNDPDAPRFPGRSLSRFWGDETALDSPDAPVLSEVEHMPWLPRSPRKPAAFGPMWLLTEDRWAYLRRHHESLGPQHWLYNLDDDPDERHNLAADPSSRSTLDRLGALLDTLGLAPPPTLAASPGNARSQRLPWRHALPKHPTSP